MMLNLIIYYRKNVAKLMNFRDIVVKFGQIMQIIIFLC